MITISNLVKYYGAHCALDHIDLQVNKGTILGLLGPNGAGKTTLVSILNGLTAFQQGEITIFGLPLANNLEAIRRRSSFIPQALALYDKLTVMENLRFFAAIQKMSAATRRANIDAALTINRLHPLLEQKAGTLSGGQKRRLNIAIGLLNNPEILYFDEPTAGIDPELRNDILETISSFKNQGKTVIYTSHYMPEIEKICDEVAIIDHGRIIRQGTLATMLQEEKGDAAIIELLPAENKLLAPLVAGLDDVELVDGGTLIMHQQNGLKMGRLLALLEAEGLAIKHISYGTTSLETLFIRLTSPGRSHA